MIHFALMIFAVWILFRVVIGAINVFVHVDWFVRCVLILIFLVVVLGFAL